MTEPLALKIPSRKTQRLQTRYQQNASIADHQSIGQCNEANADNMMDYSECLDIMLASDYNASRTKSACERSISR